MAAFIPRIAALREIAQEKLPKKVFDYIDGGSADEITLRRNREVWRRIQLIPRVLKSIGRVNTSTRLFGQRLAIPVVVAPMALHGWVHSEGEIATARAAQRCGIPLCVSMFSSKDLEDIAASGSAPVLYQQLYMLGQKSFMVTFLKRIYDQGCRCVILTVDAPVMGNREKDIENKFDFEGATFSLSKMQSWREEIGVHEDFMRLFSESMVDCDWSIIQWIKNTVNVKVLLKRTTVVCLEGILSPVDAALAVKHGADGIVISNHGGRQLDTAVTGADVLPRIAEAIGNRIPILVDGGVQRASDIIKAIAMGASAVMIGRPVLYALAAGGENAVAKLFDGLIKELEKDLALCGCKTIEDISSDLIYKP